METYLIVQCCPRAYISFKKVITLLIVSARVYLIVISGYQTWAQPYYKRKNTMDG